MAVLTEGVAVHSGRMEINTLETDSWLRRFRFVAPGGFRILAPSLRAQWLVLPGFSFSPGSNMAADLSFPTGPSGLSPSPHLVPGFNPNRYWHLVEP